MCKGARHAFLIGTHGDVGYPAFRVEGAGSGITLWRGDALRQIHLEVLAENVAADLLYVAPDALALLVEAAVQADA